MAAPAAPRPPQAPRRRPRGAPPPPPRPRYRRPEILPRPEPPATGHEALELAPHIPWRQFLREVPFAQGDHITLIGRTKSGKTTLAVGGLLPLPSIGRFVVVAGTKSRDPMYDALLAKGYKFNNTGRLDYRRAPHVIVRPELDSLADRRGQQEVFRRMLDQVFREGNWTLYLDEVRYLSDTLRLQGDLETLWLQGRTLGVTMVASTQEPVSVPRVAFSQIEHLFVFRLTDRERITRAAELAGSMTDEVREIIPRLSQHEALYVAPQADLLLRTRYPRALST